MFLEYLVCDLSTRSTSRIALYMASPPYEGLFQWRGRFRLERVDQLEEGCRPRRVLTIALHVLLNWGVEAALMCLDSLRLPSCARNPHCREARRYPTQPQLT
ncbi:hypothetical protein M9H77_08484 [Catharanthus roseus]|uniref:Uncharacterized protein n=1 Tax=Catharanthus roseus TaxID=4058 RepID=A0ACC0BY73_CATRO|nr:hypothetical protein M9H77_08484 [Catharanthus roseus]